MITARPIIFSTPMVRALLEGRKTQTRRIANRPTDHFHASYVDAIKGDDGIWYWTDEKQTVRRPVPMRHGKPGDLLWVRERAHYGPNRVAYSADNPALARGEKVDGWGPARPSIHMPRWASRLTLELTDVRVERLLDISEDDARAEGFEDGPLGDPIPETPIGDGWTVSSPGGWASAAGHFQVLWQKLHPEWDGFDSPWVWVLTFKAHHANVDAVLAQRAEVAA